MHSSLPQAQEGTELMTIHEAEGIGTNSTDTGDPEIREAYKDYLHSGNLRLALERLHVKDNAMNVWLDQWRNCWQTHGKGEEDKKFGETAGQRVARETLKVPKHARRVRAGCNTC